MTELADSELTPAQRVFRERAEVVGRFASVLAVRLGRSAEELRDSGLSVHDFQLGRGCRVSWEDGSNASFEHAFAVRDPEGGRVGVFTEHCGHFDLSELGISSVTEDGEQTRSIFPE